MYSGAALCFRLQKSLLQFLGFFLLADTRVNTNCFKMRHISNGNIDMVVFICEFNVNTVDDSRLPLR